ASSAISDRTSPAPCNLSGYPRFKLPVALWGPRTFDARRMFHSSRPNRRTEVPAMCARPTLTNRLNRVVQEMVELRLEGGPVRDEGPKLTTSPTWLAATVRATQNTADVLNLLVPNAADEMMMVVASAKVSIPKYDGPKCLGPVA